MHRKQQELRIFAVPSGILETEKQSWSQLGELSGEAPRGGYDHAVPLCASKEPGPGAGISVGRRDGVEDRMSNLQVRQFRSKEAVKATVRERICEVLRRLSLRCLTSRTQVLWKECDFQEAQEAHTLPIPTIRAS